jgi:hypothetical protein
MTQHTGSPPASAAARDEPPTQVAREQVGAAGQRVADTASDQASRVSQEARTQARDLFGQARHQVNEQARGAQQNAAEGLRSLAGELHEMAEGGDQHGPASDLAGAAADRLGELAEWLGRREPGDLIEEVRRLARRRPGAFLFGAAAAGVLAGRLTRGTVDAKRDTGGSSRGDGYRAEQFNAAGTGYAGVPPTSVGSPVGQAMPPASAGSPLPPVAPPPPGANPYPNAPGGLPPTAADAPTQPNIPTGPDVRNPAVPAPPLGDQTVGDYVDDRHRGEGRLEGPR